MTQDPSRKKIDESWKEAVEKEKEKNDNSGGPETQVPKADFGFFISSLAMEGLMALGEMENPFTKEKAINLRQAEYIIDIIDILKEKTKGNLKQEENTFIENILSDLKTRYVNKTK